MRRVMPGDFLRFWLVTTSQDPPAHAGLLQPKEAMNHPTSLAVFFALCTLGTAQLESGTYLVGTQGWDTNSKPSNLMNTIQLLSPYSGKATVLAVKGLPAHEAPATFIISNPASFLVGTKVAAAPAEGNVYRATLANGVWTAAKLNTTKLGINVSAMVTDGGYAYVIGSSIFGATGDDAQIKRIALSNGTVTTHAAFGNLFTKGKPQGAMGLGSALVLDGKTLHAFTFDSTAATPKQNEHWTISTSTPATVAQLPSLPVSKRWIGRGFGTRGAHLDPRSGDIIVVGGWGELQWRTTAGKDRGYERVAGALVFNGTHLDQMWRGSTINSDTYALAMGDHNGAGIDERRCKGAPVSKPFADNVATSVRPHLGTYAIAGMTYVAGNSTYRPIGDGCKDGSNGAPCSYSSSAPALGNKAFAFTLHTEIESVAQTTIAVLIIGPKKTKIDLSAYASGCILYVNPIGAYVLAVANSSKKDLVVAAPLPRNKGATVFTQWYVIAPKANALSAVLSDARELVVR